MIADRRQTYQQQPGPCQLSSLCTAAKTSLSSLGPSPQQLQFCRSTSFLFTTDYKRTLQMQVRLLLPTIPILWQCSTLHVRSCENCRSTYQHTAIFSHYTRFKHAFPFILRRPRHFQYQFIVHTLSATCAVSVRDQSLPTL